MPISKNNDLRELPCTQKQAAEESDFHVDSISYLTSVSVVLVELVCFLERPEEVLKDIQV